MRLRTETITARSTRDTPLFSKSLNLLFIEVERSLQLAVSWRIKTSGGWLHYMMRGP